MGYILVLVGTVGWGLVGGWNFQFREGEGHCSVGIAVRTSEPDGRLGSDSSRLRTKVHWNFYPHAESGTRW